MIVVSPRQQSNNNKLYFSNIELTKILNCYAIGVSKGEWKDYALDFYSNKAIFCFYKHTLAAPDCRLSKLKEKRGRKVIYKLSITNKKNSKFENLDLLIASLKRCQINVI